MIPSERMRITSTHLCLIPYCLLNINSMRPCCEHDHLSPEAILQPLQFHSIVIIWTRTATKCVVVARMPRRIGALREPSGPYLMSLPRHCVHVERIGRK